MGAKDQMLQQLQDLIKKMLDMRYRGGDYNRLAHAQGLVDGYMRALLETGMASQDELLGIVRDMRVAADGPALRTVRLDDVNRIVAA